MATVGDFVFDDLNGDSIQNEGEPGVAGIEVRLETPEGEILRTTTSDSNGAYEFDEVDPGDYQVTFINRDLDTFAFFVPANVGDDDTIDSDAVDRDPAPFNATTDVFTLEEGENNNTIDAGLLRRTAQPVSILVDVFFDQNQDGLLSILSDFPRTLEPDVPGTTVIVLDENGTEVRREVTDGGGIIFSGLEAGDYQVKFEIPEGFDGFTTANVTDNPDFRPDSDVDPATGLTEILSLQPGQVASVDAGLIKNSPTNDLGSIGGFVFNDLDGNGIAEAEPGISGTSVVLQNSAGEELSQTNTDLNGNYNFDDLAPGDYQVKFVLPDGFNSVSPFSVGSDRNIDSDANPENNLTSDPITLENGEINNTINAGFFDDGSQVNPVIDIEKLVQPIVFRDGAIDVSFADADSVTGPEVSVGQTVVFVYVVENAGDTALGNVNLTDDRSTPEDTSDDFAPQPILNSGNNIGDFNSNSILDTEETWLYATSEPANSGQQTSIATVFGQALDENGNSLGLADVTDADPANYLGV